MFNKKNGAAPAEINATSINLIGSGTIIKGDIVANGDIRIDGTLEGSLTSKGKLVVGATGVVEGTVNCQNADISGVVNAQVTVHELLSLKATAKLNGDIFTNKLSIEPGATFAGSCSMGGVIKDIKDGGKSEKQAAGFKEKTA